MIEIENASIPKEGARGPDYLSKFKGNVCKVHIEKEVIVNSRETCKTAIQKHESIQKPNSRIATLSRYNIDCLITVRNTTSSSPIYDRRYNCKRRRS